MKSLISKKHLTERRTKQSLDSPQTIETNNKHNKIFKFMAPIHAKLGLLVLYYLGRYLSPQCIQEVLQICAFWDYRIRANKPPLLIKPPPIQNSNKPPLFCPKSPLFGAFLGKFWKNFNKPPPQNLDFLQTAGGLLTRIRQLKLA